MQTTARVAAEALPSFAEMVDNIRHGHPEGLDQLYRLFRILSGSLRRQIGFRDFEDRFHDMFLLVVEAIREGKLRDPGALPGYICGVARLSVCAKMGVRVRHQRILGSFRYWLRARCGHETLEEQLEHKQRIKIMRDLLSTLSQLEREILTRFYLHEQTKDEICRDLRLTDTQFRLAKSRAKQRLGRIHAQRLTREQQAA